jgi:hypothetical protein
MSGRQAKVLKEQSDLYGLPFGGPTINLGQLAKALHDFLAVHARRLTSRTESGDPLLGDSSSPALEQYRRERAVLARLDRLEREEQLLPRDETHDALSRISVILRRSLETIERQHGAAAADVLRQALDEADREILQFLAPPRPESTPDALASGPS